MWPAGSDLRYLRKNLVKYPEQALGAKNTGMNRWSWGYGKFRGEGALVGNHGKYPEVEIMP